MRLQFWAPNRILKKNANRNLTRGCDSSKGKESLSVVDNISSRPSKGQEYNVDLDSQWIAWFLHLFVDNLPIRA